MLRAKPSWLFWILWLIAYSLLDVAISLIVHRTLTLAQVPTAITDAGIGATLTWAFALYRWYKADSAS